MKRADRFERSGLFCDWTGKYTKSGLEVNLCEKTENKEKYSLLLEKWCATIHLSIKGENDVITRTKKKKGEGNERTVIGQDQKD